MDAFNLPFRLIDEYHSANTIALHPLKNKKIYIRTKEGIYHLSYDIEEFIWIFYIPSYDYFRMAKGNNDTQKSYLQYQL